MPCRFDQYLNKFFQRIWLLAADVEKIAPSLVVRTGSQKGFDRVVNEGKPAQLLSITEELDFLTVNCLFHEPTRKSLFGMLHELSRAVGISEPQGNSGHSIHEVIDHVVPLSRHLVYAINI